MASLNKWTGIGNLGADPEIRYLSDGSPVANISIATTETWKDKNGDKHEKTEWHRVIYFRKLAEIVGEYVKKGMKIYVEGKLQTRKWTDKDGIERYTTEIIGQDMKMLGSKSNGNRPPAYGEKEPPAQQQTAANDGGFEQMNDDIPW